MHDPPQPPPGQPPPSSVPWWLPQVAQPACVRSWSTSGRPADATEGRPDAGFSEKLVGTVGNVEAALREGSGSGGSVSSWVRPRTFTARRAFGLFRPSGAGAGSRAATIPPAVPRFD